MSTDSDFLQQRLHTLFLEELDQHVDHLRQGLEDLARSAPRAPRDVVEEAFRAAHSLKGAAQAVGAGRVAELCHNIEDTLAGVRGGTLHTDPELLARVARETDAIEEAGVEFGLLHGKAPVPQDRAPGSPATDGVPAARLDDSPAERDSAARDSPAPTMRLSSRKLDALLAESEDVLTAIYRSGRLVGAVAEVRERLADQDRSWQSDLRTLHRAVESAVGAGAAMTALHRVEQHLRQTYGELERLSVSATAHQRGLRAAADRFAAAGRDIRSVPFTDATAGLHRLVREVCDRAGKNARLVFETADVEIDKSLAVTLREVLGHLVRNAVDHGIEPPTERQQAGKSPEGTVRITAALRSQGIEVVVADDGGGVAARDVRRVAEHSGAAAGAFDDAGLEDLLFRPGFTTAQQAGPFSGRGVGLDAVRTAIEAFGGSVRLETEAGSGTHVHISMPLTLSNLRVVRVVAAGNHIAVPSSAVSTVMCTPAVRSNVDGREVIDIDGTAVVVKHLSDLLGWEKVSQADALVDLPSLVLEAGSDKVVLTVDEVLDEREIVLRSMPERLAGLSVVLGTTQLEDGQVGLVLSPAACIRAGAARTATSAAADPRRPASAPTILLAEDSLTTRELERGILELAGYTVLVAPDGAEAWRMLGEHEVDAVVSDVDMPRMDGIALCRAIRSSPSLTGLPVVLVTSLHSEEDRRRGLDAGADAYLTKSGFDRTDLLDALERVL